jgi:hypothetical protein
VACFDPQWPDLKTEVTGKTKQLCAFRVGDRTDKTEIRAFNIPITAPVSAMIGDCEFGNCA